MKGVQHLERKEEARQNVLKDDAGKAGAIEDERRTPKQEKIRTTILESVKDATEAMSGRHPLILAGTSAIHGHRINSTLSIILLAGLFALFIVLSFTHGSFRGDTAAPQGAVQLESQDPLASWREGLTLIRPVTMSLSFGYGQGLDWKLRTLEASVLLRDRKGRFYLYGHEPEIGEPRYFRLDRITSLQTGGDDMILVDWEVMRDYLIRGVDT